MSGGTSGAGSKKASLPGARASVGASTKIATASSPKAAAAAGHTAVAAKPTSSRAPKKQVAAAVDVQASGARRSSNTATTGNTHNSTSSGKAIKSIKAKATPRDFSKNSAAFAAESLCGAVANAVVAPVDFTTETPTAISSVHVTAAESPDMNASAATPAAPPHATENASEAVAVECSSPSADVAADGVKEDALEPAGAAAAASTFATVTAPDTGGAAEALPLICLLGPPCSGKGTIAALLQQRLSFSHISTGNLLRKIADEEGDDSSLSDTMKAGQLVPDETVATLLKEAITEQEQQRQRTSGSIKGIILDGFPRNEAQVQMLENFNIWPDIFFVVQVPSSVLFKRMHARRLDPLTGQVLSPEQVEKATAEQLARLIQRVDDNDITFQERLEEYKQQIQLVLARIRAVAAARCGRGSGKDERVDTAPESGEEISEGSIPSGARSSVAGDEKALQDGTIVERREAEAEQNQNVDVIVELDGDREANAVFAEAERLIKIKFPSLCIS